MFDLLAPRRAWLVSLALSVVGSACSRRGSHDTLDVQHPRQTSLVYALDADQERASWFSADPYPTSWTDRYVDPERPDFADEFPANSIFSSPPATTLDRLP